MIPYYSDELATLFHGDCRDILATLPDNSVDSIVTDPPYELGFMGKSWDNTGVAYDVRVWTECLRVLKPGGHLLAFGGSRTYHRLAVAVEDAGFQIRDQIMWVYGSGFPKSLNVGKAIDKQAGAKREVIGSLILTGTAAIDGKAGRASVHAEGRDSVGAKKEVLVTIPATDAARQWDGWGTALKPAHEPIVLARKPFIGTVADTVLTHGTGALNINGCRVGDGGGTAGAGAGAGARVFGDGLNGEKGQTVEGLGRWPANLIHDGSDEVTALFPDSKAGKYQLNRRGVTTGRSIGGKNIYGSTAAPFDSMSGYDDSGSAARFFYSAKASKTDRNDGLDGMPPIFAPTMNDGIGGKEHNPDTASKRANFHPTVKPTDLMRYLCRLVTPPNGTILDPFCGSGSTGKAAILEGFNFIGCELTDDYLPIIVARIIHAQQNLDPPTLF